MRDSTLLKYLMKFVIQQINSVDGNETRKKTSKLTIWLNKNEVSNLDFVSWIRDEREATSTAWMKTQIDF